MNKLNLSGDIKLDEHTILTDPTVTVRTVTYDYEAMTMTVALLYTGSKYSHQRNVENIPISKENGLTTDEILSKVTTEVDKKKIDKPIK